MITPLLKPKLPRAILFDNDGVLVASEPIHVSAWKNLLAELGIPQDSQMIESMIGKTAPEILTQVLDRYRPDWDPGRYDIHELAARKNQFYLSIAQKQIQSYPGVAEGLRWLRSKKIKTAVVSNARKNELHKILAHLGLREWLDEVISRDDVGQFKPDPTPYLFAAGSLDVEPENCFALEDSPTGLEAALRAKIPSGAVLTTFPQTSLQAPVPGRPDLKPMWIGPSITEFFEWLKTL